MTYLKMLKIKLVSLCFQTTANSQALKVLDWMLDWRMLAFANKVFYACR